MARPNADRGKKKREKASLDTNRYASATCRASGFRYARQRRAGDERDEKRRRRLFNREQGACMNYLSLPDDDRCRPFRIAQRENLSLRSCSEFDAQSLDEGARKQMTLGLVSITPSTPVLALSNLDSVQTREKCAPNEKSSAVSIGQNRRTRHAP